MDSAWKVCWLVVLLGVIRAFFPVTEPHTNSSPKPKAFTLPQTLTPRDPIDEALLYSAEKYPPLISSQALRNQINRVLRGSSADTTMMQVSDHVVRATNYLLNETIPSAKELPTLVTGAWDILNSAQANPTAWILKFLKHKLPKVIFTDQQTYNRVKQSAFDLVGDQGSTVFVILSSQQIQAGLGEAALQDIYNARTNPAFLNLATWIPKSILGVSQELTVISLSRPLLVREASRLNPFRSSAFLWIDQFDECIKDNILSPRHAPALNKFFDRSVAPFITREINSQAKEVLGFRQPSFSHYSKPKTTDEDKNKKEDSTTQILRSSMFGGKPGHVEVLAAAYELVLRSSVKEGLIGNLEAYLTILAKRHPDLFHLVNDESTCTDSKRSDLTCEDSEATNVAVNGKCGFLGFALGK